MFFYRVAPPTDPWANATIFTDNFDQPAVDWQHRSYQGGGASQQNGNLVLSALDFSQASALELLNSNFTNLLNTKATRVQVKIFVSSSGQLTSDNGNWATIRVRSTWNQQGNYLNANGYKIIFKKQGGTNKIQFMTSATTNIN